MAAPSLKKNGGAKIPTPAAGATPGKDRVVSIFPRSVRDEQEGKEAGIFFGVLYRYFLR